MSQAADTDEFPGWTPPSTPDDAPELADDDDLIELAEWLDDEDDDEDFERDESGPQGASADESQPGSV